MQQTTKFKELAYRAGEGVEVSLFSSDDRLTVVVDDAKADERFALAARPDNALDVFYHPYAYASTSVCAPAAQLPIPNSR